MNNENTVLLRENESGIIEYYLVGRNCEIMPASPKLNYDNCKELLNRDDNDISNVISEIVSLYLSGKAFVRLLFDGKKTSYEKIKKIILSHELHDRIQFEFKNEFYNSYANIAEKSENIDDSEKEVIDETQETYDDPSEIINRLGNKKESIEKINKVLSSRRIDASSDAILAMFKKDDVYLLFSPCRLICAQKDYYWALRYNSIVDVSVDIEKKSVTIVADSGEKNTLNLSSMNLSNFQKIIIELSKLQNLQVTDRCFGVWDLTSEQLMKYLIILKCLFQMFEIDNGELFRICNKYKASKMWREILSIDDVDICAEWQKLCAEPYLVFSRGYLSQMLVADIYESYSSCKDIRESSGRLNDKLATFLLCDEYSTEILDKNVKAVLAKEKYMRGESSFEEYNSVVNKFLGIMTNTAIIVGFGLLAFGVKYIFDVKKYSEKKELDKAIRNEMALQRLREYSSAIVYSRKKHDMSLQELLTAAANRLKSQTTLTGEIKEIKDPESFSKWIRKTVISVHRDFEKKNNNKGTKLIEFDELKEPDKQKILNSFYFGLQKDIQTDEPEIIGFYPGTLTLSSAYVGVLYCEKGFYFKFKANEPAHFTRYEDLISYQEKNGELKMILQLQTNQKIVLGIGYASLTNEIIKKVIEKNNHEDILELTV